MPITKNHVKSAARVGGGVSTAVVIAAVCFWGNSLLGWGTGIDDQLNVVSKEVIEVKKDVEHHQEFIADQKEINQNFSGKMDAMIQSQSAMAVEVGKQTVGINYIVTEMKKREGE